MEIIFLHYFPILAYKLLGVTPRHLWHAELLGINVISDLSVLNSGMHRIYDDISIYYGR